MTESHFFYHWQLKFTLLLLHSLLLSLFSILITIHRPCVCYTAKPVGLLLNMHGCTPILTLISNAVLNILLSTCFPLNNMFLRSSLLLGVHQIDCLLLLCCVLCICNCPLIFVPLQCPLPCNITAGDISAYIPFRTLIGEVKFLGPKNIIYLT